MTNPRIAVVGLGFMGSRWSRAIAENGGADLTVVSDVRPDVAASIAGLYGATVVADPLEAAARADVDGVVVATPEHLHAEPALAAIGAGKAVAVEKPIAHTISDAEAIRDAATATRVPVLAAHILRFEPRYAALQRAVANGEIGEVQAVRSERIGLISDQDVLSGRTTIALYYGAHEFDLARWYAGDVAEVWAARSSGVVASHGHDVEDLYSVGLRFAGGAHGTAQIGWSLPPRTPGFGSAGITVIGESGMLSVSQGTTGYLKVLADGPADDDVGYSPDVHGIMHGAMGIEADHFVRCVRGDTDPACTASDGTEALRVSLAMERAADTGKAVTP